MVWLLGAVAFAESCEDPRAQRHLDAGLHALSVRDAEDALAAFRRCDDVGSECSTCREYLAYVYAQREEWGMAAMTWDSLSGTPYGEAAREQVERYRIDNPHPAVEGGLRVPLPGDAFRFQAYDPRPIGAGDVFDADVASPKSVRFLGSGAKVYVNALEGLQTLVYEPKGPSRIGEIRHVFTDADHALFGGQQTVFGYPYLRTSPSGDPNQFGGKPVEMALSHEDRWLWVPYYRRDFDLGAGSPSAVAIVDTQTDAIVRVLPTGPIPKYVAISPDDRWASVTHWGDNTVALIDISSGDPSQFSYRSERLVVEYVLDQSTLLKAHRDSACGFCLRGTVFGPDGQLWVARMGGDGGVAGFDVETGRYLGTVDGIPANPRHLLQWEDTLFVTSSRTGHVSRVSRAEVSAKLSAARGGRVRLDGVTSVHVGAGARTVDITPDGASLYVAVNARSQVVKLDAETLQIQGRWRIDAHPVGLAVSPDGTQVWVTSQANRGLGGNAVTVLPVQ
jgi:DNA-binding beta-propeller fold protein YncE